MYSCSVCMYSCSVCMYSCSVCMYSCSVCIAVVYVCIAVVYVYSNLQPDQCSMASVEICCECVSAISNILAQCKIRTIIKHK